MPITFDNGVVRLYQGDARQVLRELPAESVHCVVTSPPYWGLRDYGLEPLVWGGADHSHQWGPDGKERPGHMRPDHSGGVLHNSRGNQSYTSELSYEANRGAFCTCGAWRGSLGLEPTIDLYVQHVVEVFREVWRVLRKDGTLWLNMGDSYAGSGKGQMGNGAHSSEDGTKQGTSVGTLTGGLPTRITSGLKPKDQCMMPARVALALQADGWWLRSDIVWSKPNPMPESVTDRPTRAHEYLFMLTKAERYYYDADAIREDGSPNTHRRAAAGKDPSLDFKMEAAGRGNRNNPSFQAAMKDLPEGSDRNKRSVWEIPTEPYPEAHFATFPQKLVEPCILAGTSQRGACADCGVPWERVMEREHYGDLIPKRDMESGATRNNLGGQKVWDSYTPPKTTGWRPTCQCGQEDTAPSIVLDPFAGSGTVAYVAQRLGRRSIGIDLSAEYLALAEKRMRGQSLPMNLEAGHG